MNILIYRYNSIYEDDIINTLLSLGHSIDEIREEMTNKELEPSECVSILQKALFSKSYSMIFSVNFFPVVSEVCNIFHIPYICWIVDSPVMELYSSSIRNPWNRIFLFDRALYEEFAPENPSCIFYLPLGANCERLSPLLSSLTEDDRRLYSCEVSFIGSLYTEKCPYNRLKDSNTYLKGYLDGIIEAQLQVYGYNFLEEVIPDQILEEFKHSVPFYYFLEPSLKNEKAALAHLYLGNKVTEQERLRLLSAVAKQFPLSLYTNSDEKSIPNAIFKGIAENMTEMPKIFHLSKINLNLTSKPIRTGLPLRIWDILSAGGFLLTNYQSELPEYFEIGKDIEVYTSKEELLQKIEYYLTHEEERKAIAQSGYEKVLSEHHTLKDRLTLLLSCI